jgi:uncharacterized membrane protein
LIAIIQILLALVIPGLANWAAERNKLARLLGPVVLCYGTGILLGNLPIHLDASVAQHTSEAAVPLAIPLLLFSTEVRKWLKLGPQLLLSFALACVAAVTAAGAVGWIFRSRTDEWWKIAGMLVGVYVGGTANMSAIGIALGAKQETFILLNASDVIAGGAYLLFLLTVAQRVCLWILPPFKPTDGAAEHVETAPGAGLSRANAKPLSIAFGVAVLICGLSVAASFLFFRKLEPPFVLLAITTLGIAASLWEPIRSLAGSYDLGEYALLAFCFAVGSMADVRQVAGTSPVLFLFVVLVMTSAIVLHVGLSRIFKLDADTTLITSTATIFGPAFIGPVATALKNRQLVGPGLTLGLAGIALGTYLGLFTAWGLRALGP